MPALLEEIPSRRAFLVQLAGAGTAYVALDGCTRQPPDLTMPPAGGVASKTHSDPEPDRSWDHSWLKRITGRHKQVFDVGFLGEGQALRTVRNYLNAFRDVYGIDPPAVSAVVGIAGPAFPIDFSDDIWAKYGLGEDSKTKDPRTGGPATCNVFRQADSGEPYADYTVEALQARGVVFWMCNNALKVVTKRLATKLQMPPEVVRAELIAGLLPGVYLVPAHTMALGLAQERGCTYEAIGA